METMTYLRSIQVLKARLNTLEQRLNVLESKIEDRVQCERVECKSNYEVMTGNNREVTNLTNSNSSSFDLLNWIEEIGRSSLIRNFAISGTLLGSAWEFAESILGKIPVFLQIVTLTLIIGGSVWVVIKIIDRLYSGN